MNIHFTARRAPLWQEVNVLTNSLLKRSKRRTSVLTWGKYYRIEYWVYLWVPLTHRNTYQVRVSDWYSRVMFRGSVDHWVRFDIHCFCFLYSSRAGCSFDTKTSVIQWQGVKPSSKSRLPANQFPAAGLAVDFCQQYYPLDARPGREIASKRLPLSKVWFILSVSYDTDNGEA